MTSLLLFSVVSLSISPDHLVVFPLPSVTIDLDAVNFTPKELLELDLLAIGLQAITKATLGLDEVAKGSSVDLPLLHFIAAI